MKKTLLILFGFALLAFPNYSFCQAPVLGTTANFALFSSNGAVSNNGLSHITGNVGTNNGSSTAFGNVNGVMHANDGATVTSSADLLTAYNQLDGSIPTFFPAPLLGNGQVLNAGNYSIGGTATLDGILTLNGQGNANAVFIIQIEGAFSSSAASSVVLTNNAQACNVYWKVEGLISLASGTSMKGTMIANNAAIVMGSGVSLEGRALTTTGAITVNGVEIHTPIGCGSPLLTGPAAPVMGTVACYTLFSSTGQVTNTGVSHVIGDIGTNSGLTTGFDALNVTGTIHANPDTSTTQAAADLTSLYNAMNVLAHDIELLYPAQFGNDLVLTPHTYLLNAETVLTNNIILDAQDNANAIFVIKISGALTTSTYAKVMLINGAQAKNVFWKVTGAVNINDYSEFKGTLVNSGALILNTGTILAGRALTINGSLTTTAINAEMTPGCGTVVVPCTAPAAPVVTAQNFCTSGTVAQLTATGATGAVFNWYTSQTAVTALTPATALTTATYYVSQTVNDCESIRVGATVTITPTPAAPTVDNTQQLCAGSTVADLQATGVTGSTISWSATATGAALNTNTVLTAGTYFARQTVATCQSTTAMVTVTINTTAVPTADTTQSFCAGATVADLSANGASMQWSLTNGGAALSNSTVLVSGNYFVSQTVGGCESTGLSVAVTINTIPVAPTVDNTQQLCAGSTVADLQATGVTGSTISWSATATGAALNANTVLTAGTYFARQTVATCQSTTAMVTVTINTTAVPTADTTQSFCAGATVADLSATGASMQWSLTNGGTALSNSTVLVSGNYFVSQTVGGCESNALNVAVTINAIPAMPIVDNTQQLCAGSTVADLEATGVTGSTISWSATATGAALNANTVLTAGTYFARQTVTTCQSPAALVNVTITTTAVPTADTTQSFCAGATVADLSANGASMQWSLTNGGAALSNSAVLVSGNYFVSQTVGGCESNALTVAVTINAIPAMPTVDNTQQLCAGATVADLQATGVTGSTISWSATATGAALNANTVLTAGTYFARQTVATCQSPAALVNVTINTTAVPTADTTQSFCAGATVADLSATGASMQWSLTNGGAALSNSAVLVSGNYFVSQTVGGCESNALTVAVTINAIPVMPTGNSIQDFNTGETVGALEVSGSNVVWYIMTDGELVSIPTSTVLTDGETYYASQMANGCESDYFEVTANELLGTVSFDLKKIIVYPNPVTDMLTVSGDVTITNVAVFNLLGQQVLQQSSTENTVKVNVENLAAGTYLLQATSDSGKNASFKIVKL
ncbi:ice-binding family protein [Flavobacterium sp. DGU11]|uniref:Ice-binding family protein n=1 Tax=Flavobacterium arundinis TaxID=3139143 RepID=A0ABU9I0F1_9FLAO